MGKFLRLTASHGVLFPSVSPQVTRLVNTLRNREALSNFLDYTARKRAVVELRARPARRKANYGKYLWLEHVSAPGAAFEELSVRSGPDPKLQTRLHQHAVLGVHDPLLLNVTRPTCSEPKALQHFMDKHDPHIAPVRGQLWLWTERFPCADCQQLIGNFLSK